VKYALNSGNAVSSGHCGTSLKGNSSRLLPASIVGFPMSNPSLPKNLWKI